MSAKRKPAKAVECEVLRPALVISGPSLRAKALKAQADVMPEMMAVLMSLLDEEAGRGKLEALVPMRVLMPDGELSQEELALAMTSALQRLGCFSRVVEHKETKRGGAWETRRVCLEVSWREPML